MAQLPLFVKVAGLELVKSDVVICAPDESVSLTFGNAPNSIDVKIIFEKDDSGEKKVRKEHPSLSTIEIKFVNFDNTLGTALTTPIEVVSFGSRKVFINVAVYLIGSTRMLCYSIYMEL